MCQQHSEQMYSDLIKKITNHLERVSKELQVRSCTVLFSWDLTFYWGKHISDNLKGLLSQIMAVCNESSV